jgi:NTE family protein
MFLDKSDPTAIPETGVYIQPNLEGYSALDFTQAKAMIDSGYFQTLRQLEEIKSKVSGRRSCENVTQSRNHFNSQSKPWVFEGISFKSFNWKQRRYLRNVFKVEANDENTLYFLDVKRGYYKLVAEPYFSNVYPSMIFNESSQKFKLQLTRRPQKNFQVEFGGVLATRDISNIALGLNYYHFGRVLTHAEANFQTGSFYKSAIARTRIEVPLLSQFYLQPEVIFNQWDYLESADLLQKTSPSVLKRFDRKVAMHVGKAMGSHFKSVISVEGFRNEDRYSNKKSFVSTDTLDELKIKGYRAGITFSMNDLNNKQYASMGKAYEISANYYNVEERYTPGNTADAGKIENSKSHQWFRVRATAEHYFSRGWYRPGYYAEAVFSNQPFFNNYTGTIINTPAFSPLQDSRTLILENFRAFNYAAFGIRNVFIIRSKLDFRLEGYAFKPFEHIQEGQNQEAFVNSELTQLFFAGSAGLVFHSPVGPVSLSVNYYDDQENELGVLLHVGFLLFTKHSIEQ